MQVSARWAAIQTSTLLWGLSSLTGLLTMGQRDRCSSAEEGMRCCDLSTLEGLWDVWAVSRECATFISGSHLSWG